MTDEQFVQFVLPPTKRNPCLKMQGGKELHYAKKTAKFILLIILLISATFAMGQHMPQGKWWYNPCLSEQLNLSMEEKRQLDDIFIESRLSLIGLKSSVEREQFELQNLLKSKALDEAAVMEQFKRLENARAGLGAERFNLLLEIRRIIGFERFQCLAADSTAQSRFNAGCTTFIHPGRPAPPACKIRLWVPGHHNACGIWVRDH